MSYLQLDQIDIEDLPQELRDRFPDTVEDLRTGAIEEIPDAVLDQLPTSVVDRIPDALLISEVNTTFVIILGVIAAIALAGFLWGITKAAIKAAVFFAVLALAAAVFMYAQF